MLRERLLAPEPAECSERSLDAPTEHSNIGSNTIGTFGSLVLCYNTLVGPGMLELPHVVQKGGILPVLAALGGVCVISSFGVTMFCDVMARIPDDRSVSGTSLPDVGPERSAGSSAGSSAHGSGKAVRRLLRRAGDPAPRSVALSPRGRLARPAVHLGLGAAAAVVGERARRVRGAARVLGRVRVRPRPPLLQGHAAPLLRVEHGAVHRVDRRDRAGDAPPSASPHAPAVVPPCSADALASCFGASRPTL
jgi:hypothetical protein